MVVYLTNDSDGVRGMSMCGRKKEGIMIVAGARPRC